MNNLPATMRALELHDYTGWRTGLRLVEKPVPRPGPGQVLIKIAASPVNPSDIVFLKGYYGIKKELPVVPGLEASGTVVAAGGGMAAHFLQGRRVACAASNQSDGAWAEYMVTSATNCIPLLKNVSDEQGATLLVNPLSAWGMIDLARRGQHRAVVNTAAAGALGRMLFRLGQHAGLTVVNLVRRPEQVDILSELGAEYVLSTHQPDFDDQLKTVCREVNATLAFDAVAGEMTDSLLRAMPKRSRIVVYGSLSNTPSQVNAGLLIFKNQKINGFWLNHWRPRFGLAGLLYAGWQIQKLLETELKTEVQATLPLAKAGEGFQMYINDMTKGKILFMPGRY